MWSSTGPIFMGLDMKGYYSTLLLQQDEFEQYLHVPRMHTQLP